MKCRYHPKREAFLMCEKYKLGYCERCCRCPSPGSACSFRISCPIWQFCGSEEKKYQERLMKNHPILLTKEKVRIVTAYLLGDISNTFSKRNSKGNYKDRKKKIQSGKL